MICPRCRNSNPQGSEFCAFCSEILLHSAAKNYQRQHRSSGPRRSSFFSFRSILALLPSAGSGFKAAVRSAGTLVRRAGPILLVLAGTTLIGGTAFYYHSPLTALRVKGVRLKNRAGLGSPMTSLIGTHVESKTWSEMGGRLDTPLGEAAVDETGSVVTEAAPRTGSFARATVRAVEWIKRLRTADKDLPLSLPLNHPSLATASVVLDDDRTLVERQGADSARVGRATQFLFPRFPKGAQFPGSRWTESIEWTEPIGDWKIHWQADLQWVVQRFEVVYEKPCVRLAYKAELHPHLLAGPAWAAKATGTPAFEGQGSGEALYSAASQSLLSNSFSYSGRLAIPLDTLERIPIENRVGNPLTMEPGVIAVQFTSRLDARNP